MTIKISALPEEGSRSAVAAVLVNSNSGEDLTPMLLRMDERIAALAAPLETMLAYKTEADTLRRIVMEALAEFEREQRIGMPPDHWTNRARKAFGIEEEQWTR